MRRELREMVQKLTQDKTDRQSLGQMLVEIGGQLTRGRLADAATGITRRLDVHLPLV